GLLLDTVPNHMGINNPGNGWWMDVIENGPSSVFSSYFDIDWHPANPILRNKVLLPILEDQYGVVLESAKLRLAFENGSFFLYYYEHQLPVNPDSYSTLLQHRLKDVEDALGGDNPHVQELFSIITAVNHLPNALKTASEK